MSSTGSTGNMLNTGALLRAGGIGLAVGFVLQIISAGLSIVTSATISPAASGLDSSTAGTAAMGLGGVGICLCCVAVLMYAAIGVGYAWFAGKDAPLEAGPAALGGGVAALADGILLGICGAGINYLTSVLNLAVQSGDPAFGTALGGTLGLPFAGLGLILGVCVYPLIYAALGAAGAAIYAAATSNRSKPQPAAM